MFKKKTPPEPTAIEKAIAECYIQLATKQPDTKEYAKTLKQISELEKLNNLKNKKTRLFTPDTLLIVGANIVGILLILNYEKADIVASKALGLVSKPRI